jgi:hypothetical protein
MHVRIHERRREEAALGVELGDAVVAIDPDGAGRADLGDSIAVGPDVLQRDVGARGRMDARVPNEQPRRGSLPA